MVGWGITVVCLSFYVVAVGLAYLIFVRKHRSKSSPLGWLDFCAPCSLSACSWLGSQMTERTLSIISFLGTLRAGHASCDVEKPRRALPARSLLRNFLPFITVFSRRSHAQDNAALSVPSSN